MKTSHRARKIPRRPLESGPLTRPAAASPLSIKSASSLSEDFLERQDLYLSPGSSTLALYKNPFKANLVEGAVAVDGSYYTLAHDPSGGPWRLEKYDDPTNPLVGCITVASVVYPEDGSVGTVASTPDYLYYFTITKDGPQYFNAETDVKGITKLKVAYTPPLPQRIPTVYGATPDGNLMITRWTQDTQDGLHFEPTTFNVGGVLASAEFVLASLNRSYHVLITVVNGILTWYVIQGLNVFNILGPYSATSLAVKQVIMAYQSDLSAIDLVVLGPEDDTTHESQVYLAFGLGGSEPWAPTLQAVGNITASRGAGVLDAESLMHLYLIDSNNKVSVLHQTGWTTGYPAYLQPVFTTATRESTVETAVGSQVVPVAIPLAGGIAHIAVDPYPVDHPVLAAYAAAGRGADQPPASIRLIGQDGETLEWWNEPVQLAATQFYKVSRWQTRATLLDRNRNPVPLYYLSLHAETTCTVDIGGESYVLDPHRPPVEVRTNLSGQLVFSTPALGLTTPAITISGEGLPASAEIRPDEGVQSYIAGTGTLPFKPTFDGATLFDATVDGRPLAPNLPGKTPDEKLAAANALVENIRKTIALADPNMPQPQCAGFLFQIYDPDRPAFETFATLDELEVARARVRALPQFGGFWDDVEDFAGVSGLRFSRRATC